MQSTYPIRKMRTEPRDRSRSSAAKQRTIERRKMRRIKEATR
jgi:hypothetical protein